MTDDSTLKQRVLDELAWDPRVDDAQIGVTVSDGSVTLTGNVATYPAKRDAVDATKRVRGVTAIADDIEVHIPGTHRHDDTNIAERIAHVLEWNVAIPDGSIQAKVRDGIVTLSGKVDWWHQREHIGSQVGHVSGVRSVINTIHLKSHTPPKDVKKKIESALVRHSEKEADNIRIDVSDGVVTLSGKVRAFYERDLAERAAWMTPGVRQVVDTIRIG